MTTPWLGHWNGCSIQHSDICDCDPDNPVNLAEVDLFKVLDEMAGESDG